jgi:hypothetical protein
METLGYFPAELLDLHDSKIELLQLNKRGKLLVHVSFPSTLMHGRG